MMKLILLVTTNFFLKSGNSQEQPSDGGVALLMGNVLNRSLMPLPVLSCRGIIL